MPSINDITTVVIVLMENRSFDHMLGYTPLKRATLYEQPTVAALLRSMGAKE